MDHSQQQDTASPEVIAEKLAELNAVHATCEQRCLQGCDWQVRANYMTLRIWFEMQHIPIVLQQGLYVIESTPQDAQGSSALLARRAGLTMRSKGGEQGC